MEFLGSDLQKGGLSAFIPGGSAAWSELAVSGNTTLSAAQFQSVVATPQESNYTINLPAPSSVPNQIGYFKRLSSNLRGGILLSGPIDDDSSYLLEYDNEFVVLYSNGTTFRVMGE